MLNINNRLRRGCTRFLDSFSPGIMTLSNVLFVSKTSELKRHYQSVNTNAGEYA